MALNTDKAIVLFSGGQDSATCLAWALERYRWVETLGFAYGQRHDVELAARVRVREEIADAFPDWAAKLGEDRMLDLAALGEISETAMTRETEIDIGAGGLPTTFVPGRNLAFLVFAAAYAWRRGAANLVGGMCETDYSGYPDCRRDTIDAQEDAIRRGMDGAFRIETPLMHIDKAGTWRLAEKLGGKRLVDIIVERSHTCYKGDRSKRHAWGYGCGTCPACELRARGWERYAG